MKKLNNTYKALSTETESEIEVRGGGRHGKHTVSFGV